MLHIGIDLGGTKTELIALDDAGRELHRERRPTPQGDYAATLANIVSLVQDAERRLNRRATVGIGIPGALSRRTGRVKNANSTWLIGEDLKGDLERALERAVRVENDANCFALSEADRRRRRRSRERLWRDHRHRVRWRAGLAGADHRWHQRHCRGVGT